MESVELAFEPAKTLMTVQYARALAALMVVVWHLEQPMIRLAHITHWPTTLLGGVDIFFVISGFIMWMTTFCRPTSPVAFMGKRLLRIAPLYWIMTSFFVVILVVKPELFFSSKFNPLHIVKSYLFIPAHHPVMNSMLPVLLQGWTLIYEMFFYMIFAVCLLMRPAPRLWAAVSVLLILVLAGQFVTRMSVFGFYTDSIILEFAYGLMLGAIVSSGKSVTLRLACAAFVAGAMGLLALRGLQEAGVLPRCILMGLPALLMVGGAIFVEKQGAAPRWPWLSLIGDASYSIYLTHTITLAGFWFLWSHAHLGSSLAFVAAYIVLAVAVSTAAGIACYFVVERPVTAFLRARFSRAPPALAPL